jgi:hypothetical protein
MSQEQAPTQQSAPTQEAPQTESAGVDAVGNAQRTQEAGLGGAGAAPAEMGIIGPFASMILDAMPMAAALPMAKQFITNPEVQKWVLGQDLTQVVKDIGCLTNLLLPGIWPVGVGFDWESELAGKLVAGAGFMGHAKVMHSSASKMDLEVKLEGAFGLGAGVGGKVSDAFGDSAGLMAKAGLTIGVSEKDTFSVDMDLMPLIQATQNIDPSFLLNVLKGTVSGRGIIDFGTDVAKYLTAIATETATATWDREQKFTVGADASAIGGSESGLAYLAEGAEEHLTELEKMVVALTPWLSVAMGGALEIMPTGLGQFDIKLTCDSAGAVELFTAMPEMKGVLDGTTLEWLANGASIGLEIDLQIPATVEMISGRLSLDPAAAMVTHRVGAKLDKTDVTDGLMIPLMDLPALVATMSMGGDLDEMLDAGSLPGFSREIQIRVTAETLSSVYPAWTALIDELPERSMMSESILYLEGQADLAPTAFDVLRGRGIQVPGGMDGFGALLSLGSLAVANATGNIMEAAPEWRAGHEDALFELAAMVNVGEARLRGHIHIGVGGGVDAAEAIEASSTARTEAGVAIDTTVAGEEASRVVKALGQGLSAA